MAEKIDDKRIDEALEFLNNLARERLAELQDIVSDKYGNLKSIFGEAAERLQQQARETYDQGKEKVKGLVSNVDDSVHKNPWPYLGGAALGFLILGFALGKSRK